MEGITLTNGFENTRRVLAEYGEAVVEAYRAELADRGKDTVQDHPGSLSRNISFEVRADEGGLFPAAFSVELTLPAHWYNVEMGRPPCPPSKGWIPPDALMEWIKVKPVIPRPDDSGRIPTLKQLAYLINRAINDPDRKGDDPKRPGIAPAPVMQSAVDAVNEKYDPLIKAAVFEDMQVYIRDVLFSDFHDRESMKVTNVR